MIVPSSNKITSQHIRCHLLTLVVTEEANVLRNGGETYANKLRAANVARNLAIDALKKALRDN